jgi:putative phosphonate metabolism protein
MTGFPRYAIYYAAPRGSTLDRFGAELLGYDAWTGEDLSFPDGVTETVTDWREVTGDPRKYGFHATLKAPFALAAGRTEAELVAACAAFAAEPRAIPSFRPVVDSISGFIAAIPVERSPPLEALAADCVTAFDSFRASLAERDRARRNPEKLTERQRDHLDRWGYPYVMEEFRFHMTLTGRLDATRRWGVLEMLRKRFVATGIDSLSVDRITLFRQDALDTRFRIVGDWPLVEDLIHP